MRLKKLSVHSFSRAFFINTRPGSTMVEDSRLVDPAMKIEIEAVAHTKG